MPLFGKIIHSHAGTFKIIQTNVDHIAQIGYIAVCQHDWKFQVPQRFVERFAFKQTGHDQTFNIPVAQKRRQFFGVGQRPDHKKIASLPQGFFDRTGQIHKERV